MGWDGAEKCYEKMKTIQRQSVWIMKWRTQDLEADHRQPEQKYSFSYHTLWYGDGAGNTVEENSSIFSLIRLC